MLLYTLVYGAMPFDGSNFKRLVKQISSGEYYEPPDKPSSWFTFLTNKILDGILFIFHNFFLLLSLLPFWNASSCFAFGSPHAAGRSGQTGQRRGHLLPLVKYIK